MLPYTFEGNQLADLVLLDQPAQSGCRLVVVTGLSGRIARCLLLTTRYCPATEPAIDTCAIPHDNPMYSEFIKLQTEVRPSLIPLVFIGYPSNLAFFRSQAFDLGY